MKRGPMIATQTLPRLSAEAYLAYEHESDCRHELVDGYLYAMTGARRSSPI